MRSVWVMVSRDLFRFMLARSSNSAAGGGQGGGFFFSDVRSRGIERLKLTYFGRSDCFGAFRGAWVVRLRLQICSFDAELLVRRICSDDFMSKDKCRALVFRSHATYISSL